MIVRWHDLRNSFGTATTRAPLLRFFCEVTGYRPLQHQVHMHLACQHPDDTAAYGTKLTLGGIGAGKTKGGTAEDAMVCIANPGIWAVLTAPTTDQVQNVLLPHWLTWCRLLERAGYPILAGHNYSFSRSDLICGGRVFFRTSAKIDNILGFEFGLVHQDECCIPVRARRNWETLAGRIRQPGLNFREHLGTSSPRGLSGPIELVHQIRENAKGIVDPLERSQWRRRWWWQRVPSSANPHLPDGYWTICGPRCRAVGPRRS